VRPHRCDVCRLHGRAGRKEDYCLHGRSPLYHRLAQRHSPARSCVMNRCMRFRETVCNLFDPPPGCKFHRAASRRRRSAEPKYHGSRKSFPTAGRPVIFRVYDVALEVKDLAKHLTLAAVGRGRLIVGQQILKAVDRISFTVTGGQSFRSRGESGCGKSTTARLITRLYHRDQRRGLLRRERDPQTSQQGGARTTQADSDDFSGSLRVAESAHEGRRYHWTAGAHFLAARRGERKWIGW